MSNRRRTRVGDGRREANTKGLEYYGGLIGLDEGGRDEGATFGTSIPTFAAWGNTAFCSRRILVI